MNANTLRLGDVGSDVVTLQQRLNRAGIVVAIDGHFGRATDRAVRAYQADAGMLVDGIAGARTHAALLGQGVNPKHLTEADINAAAATLGCDAAAVHAIIEVEAPRGGFLSDGRVRILFERHIFYGQLEAIGIDPTPYVAMMPDTCNPKPGGYGGGATEYSRLALAQQINADCALESASWGRMQVMGYHWRDLDYADAAAFVADMQAGESAQLRAGVKLIMADESMRKALAARDWAFFAAQYNGPAYADHGYDLRLAAAWRRYATEGARAAESAAATPPEPPRRTRKAAAADAAASTDDAAESIA